MITEDQEVSVNKIFINIVSNLKISPSHGYDIDFLVTNDQVKNVVNKFRNCPSIIMIKSQIKIDQCFSFGLVIYDDVLKKTQNNLVAANASQQSDIPTKILKQNSDYFVEYFCGDINQCISKSVFPPDLKLADVTPV